jgi:hypothetical protein
MDAHRSLLMGDGYELLLDTFDVDATGRQRDLSPGNAGAGRYHPITRPSIETFLPLKGPSSSNASEKTRDLDPTQPGKQQTDVISEGWNGGAECILFFVRVSSFVSRISLGPELLQLPSTVRSTFHDRLVAYHRKRRGVTRCGRPGHRLVQSSIASGRNPGRHIIIITTSRAGPCVGWTELVRRSRYHPVAPELEPEHDMCPFDTVATMVAAIYRPLYTK